MRFLSVAEAIQYNEVCIPPTTTAPLQKAKGRQRAVNVLLWTAQGLLAVIFLFAGGIKLALPIDVLTAQMPLPGLFLRFIGLSEVLGAIALIVPGLVRVRPGLTPLAAAGLVLIMIGATTLTVMSGQIVSALVPLTVGLMAALVAYGRSSTIR